MFYKIKIVSSNNKYHTDKLKNTSETIYIKTETNIIESNILVILESNLNSIKNQMIKVALKDVITSVGDSYVDFNDITLVKSTKKEFKLILPNTMFEFLDGLDININITKINIFQNGVKL